MPPCALGSEPRPAPSLPAPEPSPCNPLPGPLPRPMPDPPPLPPRPVFAVPVGDMAIAPPPVEFGRPTFVPGWLEMTTPLPAAFPPALAGGATAEPKSSGPPAPVPLLPRPLPERALPPPRLGWRRHDAPIPAAPGGLAGPPAAGSLLRAALRRCSPEVEPLAASVFPPDLASDPPPDAHGGGGTGLPQVAAAVLPQLLRSRLTCDGGGATTAGAGSDSWAWTRVARRRRNGWGDDVEVCENGTRELARSRGVSRGAGATTVGASGFAVRILSRETFGAGGTMGVEVRGYGELRVLAWETSGAGGMTLVVRPL